MLTGAHLKAELLSRGVTIAPQLLAHYGPPYLEKRRAYGNSDPLALRDATLPQEFYLLPENLIVAVNVREDSPWSLDWDGEFFLAGPSGQRVAITFPRRPAFYDYTTDNGRELARIATLYGGGSLGLFIYGSCALVDMGKACQYCSIEPNHKHGVDFEKVIRPEQVEEAVELALSDAEAPLSQVMLNGGNFRDLDRSFLYYVETVKAAERAIARSGREVELHLIVYPPRDLELFHELADTQACVAINSEVFDPDLFESYCPGKAVTAGQRHIFAALTRAAEVLGPGRAYSIIVGGLEDADALAAPMRRLAERGVVPVINVFHADPETPLARHPAPPREQIVRMGEHLQGVYADLQEVRPFYLNCGRNSIDTEAYLQLF